MHHRQEVPEKAGLRRYYKVKDYRVIMGNVTNEGAKHRPWIQVLQVD